MRASPITYFIADGGRQTGFQPPDRQLAQWAFEAWARSSGERFRFEAASESSAVIRLYWAESNEGQYGEMRPLTVGGRRGAAVYIRPDVDSLGDDIARRARVDPLLRDSIVYLTCLHELGHALGLMHTSEGPAERRAAVCLSRAARSRARTAQALCSGAGGADEGEPHLRVVRRARAASGNAGEAFIASRNRRGSRPDRDAVTLSHTAAGAPGHRALTYVAGCGRSFTYRIFISAGWTGVSSRRSLRRSASVAPDLVAVSGDFTQRARASQFAEARDFLHALPVPRLVVPGNHDVPLYDVARRFLRPLARYQRFIAGRSGADVRRHGNRRARPEQRAIALRSAAAA